MKTSISCLRYGVGFDIGKDTIHVCVSVIDSAGKVTIKGTSKISNTVAAFSALQTWISKHCKQPELPVRYVMESTGVYHEGSAPAATSLVSIPAGLSGKCDLAQQSQAARRSGITSRA